MDELSHVYGSLAVDRAMRAPNLGLGRYVSKGTMQMEDYSKSSVLSHFRSTLDAIFPVNLLKRDHWFEKKDATTLLRNTHNVRVDLHSRVKTDE